MSKSKGSPIVLVSQENHKAVTSAANDLGVTISTIANLVLQSTIAAARACLKEEVVDRLSRQDPPKPTAINSGVRLPISTHTTRVLSQASAYLQLSEETIALWAIHEFLPKIKGIEPLNRHTLPPAIYNRVSRMEQTNYGKT